MFTIEKTFTFEAAHFLRDFDGDCGRIHGHSYRVVLVLQSATLDATGFVREFRDLDQFKHHLDQNFDHQLLNDIAPFNVINPTTELLACELFGIAKGMFPETACVRVSETAKTSVEYRE